MIFSVSISGSIFDRILIENWSNKDLQNPALGRHFRSKGHLLTPSWAQNGVKTVGNGKMLLMMISATLHKTKEFTTRFLDGPNFTQWFTVYSCRRLNCSRQVNSDMLPPRTLVDDKGLSAQYTFSQTLAIPPARRLKRHACDDEWWPPSWLNLQPRWLGENVFDEKPYFQHGIQFVPYSVSGSVLEAPGLPGITLRLRLSVSGQRKNTKQNKIHPWRLLWPVGMSGCPAGSAMERTSSNPTRHAKNTRGARSLGVGPRRTAPWMLVRARHAGARWQFSLQNWQTNAGETRNRPQNDPRNPCGTSILMTCLKICMRPWIRRLWIRTKIEHKNSSNIVSCTVYVQPRVFYRLCSLVPFTCNMMFCTVYVQYWRSLNGIQSRPFRANLGCT